MLAALVGCATASYVHAKELWEIPWIEVRTPHFVVVSSISPERTIKLVYRLEDFRFAVGLLTSIDRFEERIPTKLYVFPTTNSTFGLSNGIVGYFIPEMRANYAAAVPLPGGGLAEVIKHEYVHFLVHNSSGRNFPRWFSEGFAQMLETLDVHGTRLEFGEPPTYALENLRYGTWLPFTRILRTADTFQLGGSRAAMFYAQSWLLVHYLQNGRKGHSFAAENEAYLTAVEAGTDPVAAFESAFGIAVNELRSVLNLYGARDMQHLTFTLKQPFPQASAVTTPVSPSSICAQLADLLFVRGAADAAKPYLDTAITLDPNNGAALVALGDLHKFAGRFDEAQPYYEKAIAAEPKNAYHQLDYGEFFLAKAKASTNPDEVASNLIEARRHFARSDALDPTVPETLAMNGATYLFPGQSVDKGIVSLVAAQEMLPSQLEIAALLATAYAAGGQKEKAVNLLRASLAWRDAEDPDTQAARKKLEEWVAAPKSSDAPDASDTVSDDTAE